MGLNNKTNLKSQASTIRHENQEGLNTAERVGKVLEELIVSADASLTTETNARIQANNNLTQQLTIASNTATTAYNEAKDAKSNAVAAQNSANAAQSTADTAIATANAAKAAIEIRCDDLLKGGTWTWGLAATKPTDIKAGRRITLHYGDDADTDIEGVVLSVETGKNQFEVAVYDGATKSEGMLVLVFTIGTTAKTMTAKRLVESTDARLKHIYNVQFTYDADGAKSTWYAGVEAGVVRQGDELRWLEGENGGIYDVFATVVGETNRDLCAVYFMEEEQQQTLRVIWLCYDGSVLETTFDSADVISNALNKKQDSLIDSDDITVGTNNKLSLTEKHVRKIHTITLTRVADLRYSWSGAALGDIRQGDILTWTDADEMFRAVVFGERTSGTRREVCAMFTRDGDEAIEFSLLWLYENGEAYETVFDSSQTLAGQFAACQNKLTDTADIQVRAEARPSGQHYTPYGLYLKDSAKRAVFNDMFNLAAGSDGGYKPSEAPDPAKPYLLNTLWLSYEEAVKVYAINGADAGHILPDIGRRYSYYFGAPLVYSVRTLFKVCGHTQSYGMFFGNAKLEVVNVDISGSLAWVFRGNSKLKTVLGTVEISEVTSGDNLIWDCALLEDVNLKGLRNNIRMRGCPKLSLATMQYLVDNASTAITAEKPVVVTVHADVFAKLTGDTTNEAAAALTDDEKTAWAAVLTAATSKYISFATD